MMGPTRYDQETIRKAVMEGNLGWKVGPNPLSKVPLEVARKRYGAVISDKMRRTYLEDRERALDYQKRYGIVFSPCQMRDWRDYQNHNYVTPPKDQGESSACTAFAITAALESNLAIWSNSPVDTNPIDLSEADLYYCPYDPELDCIIGMEIEVGLKRVIERGLCDESIWPWNYNISRCDKPTVPDECIDCRPVADRGNDLKKMAGWHAMSLMDEAKEWICDHGPVVSQMVITSYLNDWFKGDSGSDPAQDVYRSIPGYSEVFTCHSVCVIGFKDTSEIPSGGYWICKDSSGNFGGYFKIAYGECAMLSHYIDTLNDTDYIFPFYALNFQLKPMVGHDKLRYPFPIRRWPPIPLSIDPGDVVSQPSQAEQ